MEDQLLPNDNEMPTLSAVMNTVAKDGYVNEFKVKDGILIFNEEHYSPDDIKITSFYRFEGESDPADNAILYIIDTKDGHKGILLDAYGVYSNEELNLFIQKVHEIEKRGAEKA